MGQLDPRSADLSTELGFVVYSPLLAGRLQDAFDQGLHRIAYELRLPAHLWRGRSASTHVLS